MIDQKDISFFEDQGYLLLKNLLSEEYVAELSQAIDKIAEQDGPFIFRESNSRAIRTIFAPELVDSKFKELLTDEAIIKVVNALLGEPFYLFQSKYNNKASLASGSWSWHQDFTFWKDDGMPQAKALTMAVFLSDVTPFSGPIIGIPGTHKEGTITHRLNNPDGVHDENLKYLIAPETIKEMVEKYGEMKAFTGDKGSVLFFHSDLLHSSYQNMFHEDRKVLMFTFNPISNKTNEIEDPRPNYMVQRSFIPLN